MTEERQRSLDILVKGGAAILTLVGILVGVWQFNSGQRSRVKTEGRILLKKDDLEFRRRLWLERLNTYKTVAEIAGRIVANLDHAKDRRKYFADFVAAYWGTMIFVEDKDVENAMIGFYLEVQDFEGGWSNAERIKVRADQLISACRTSVERGEPRR